MKMQSVTYNETVIVAGKIGDLKSISGGYFEFKKKIDTIYVGSLPICSFDLNYPRSVSCGYICETPSAVALGESASFFAISSGSVVGSISLTTSAYKVVHELGKPNQIKRNTLVTGTDETAYMRKHNILEDVGTVIDLANKTFENKEYQLQLDLVADPEAEHWETLVCRFFVGLTPPEILHYQKQLVKNFVARVEPSKRSYFSMVVEPV